MVLFYRVGKLVVVRAFGAREQYGESGIDFYESTDRNHLPDFVDLIVAEGDAAGSPIHHVLGGSDPREGCWQAMNLDISAWRFAKFQSPGAVARVWIREV
jgi:hypothetical protein